MKLQKAVKRIVALGTSATMLGATLMGATAADLSEYPSQFVQDGKFNGLIVIGEDAAPKDVIGATDIISSLQAVAVGGGSDGVTVETVGDVYRVAKTSTFLNIGDNVDSVKSLLDEDELPVVLADGSIRTDEGTTYEYEQKIRFAQGDSGAHTVEHFDDNDYADDTPVVGIRIGDQMQVLNYTLEFTEAAKSDNTTAGNAEDLEDIQIEMLGESFDIVKAELNEGGTTEKLTLMRGAIRDTIEEGETKTYTINGKDYEVTALLVDDTNSKVKFKVNGEVTDSMVEDDIHTSSDGTNIGVREILPNEAGDVTQDLVEFYLGARKIVIEDTQELELDGEDVDEVYGYITSGSSGSKVTLSSIVINWKTDEDVFLVNGEEVVLPGLESIKLWTTGFHMGKEEVTKLQPNGDDNFEIQAPLKNYDVNLDVLFDNGGDGDWDIVGEATDKVLLTNATGGIDYDEDTHKYFIVTYISGEEAESHVLEVTKVDDTDGATVKDYAGNTVGSDKNEGETIDIGEITLTVAGIDQAANQANFTVTPTDGTVVDNMLVTKEGLKISLPYLNSTGVIVGDGIIDSSATTAGTGGVFFRLEAEDNDENVGSGSPDIHFNVTFNSDNEATVSGINKTNVFSNNNTYEDGNTDVFVGYTLGDVSVKVMNDQSGDQEDLEISYPGEETYLDLYVGSKASQVKSSGSGESVSMSKIEVGAAVLDSSLASYTDQNLIVVGGPAVNRAAAALLGKTYPAYGAESGIPENAGLIKAVENADGTVGMIVAGWEADDTRRAAIVLAEYDDHDLSGEEVQVTGTSMTDITVGVPAMDDMADTETA